jgi:hypothetical protein
MTKVIKYIGTITYDNNVVFNKFEGSEDAFLDKYLELEKRYKDIIVKEPNELAEIRERMFIKEYNDSLENYKKHAEKAKYHALEIISKDKPDISVIPLNIYNELSDIKTESNIVKSNLTLVQRLQNYLIKNGLFKRQTNK